MEHCRLSWEYASFRGYGIVFCLSNEFFGRPYDQGGSEVVRSLDSMMQAALSYDYNEGPRLVATL